MNTELHHLGYACKDIKQAINFFRAKHSIKHVSEIVYDPYQRCNLCILDIEGSLPIELVEGKTVQQFIKNDQPTLYHVCYEVDDIQLYTEKLKSSGATQVTDLAPAPLFNDRKVIFFKNELGLIELLESSTLTAKSTKAHKKQLNIHINSTFTADPVCKHLNVIFNKLGVSGFEVSDITYSNIITTPKKHLQITASLSKLNIFLIRISDWFQFEEVNYDNFVKVIDDACDTLIANTKQQSKTTYFPLIFLFCPCTEVITDPNLQKYIRNKERWLAKQLNKLTSVIAITSKMQMDSFEWKTKQKYTDLYSLKTAHIPYNKEFYALLSLSISQQVIKSIGSPFKVIVIDCDDTLWQGTCAEARSCTEVVVTKEHKKFQRLLKEYSRLGYLLCLCSKNAETDVLNVLKTHPDMILKIEDITAWKIDWNSKVKNLEEIAKELNLNLDSFIFIDNNPIECNEVKKCLPQVLSIQIPENPAHLPAFMNSFWMIQYKKSQTSKVRQQFYKQEKLRQQNRKNTDSAKTFIQSLNLEIEPIYVKRDNLKAIARAVEMSNRVTQFNLSGNKYTEYQIKQMLEDHQIIQLSLRDKFGDYGTIATCVFHTNSNNLIIDDVYVSCRAFYRGVEHYLFQEIIKQATKLQKTRICFTFKETVRNKPVKLFIEKLQCNPVNTNFINNEFTFCLDIEKLKALTFKPHDEVKISPDNSPIEHSGMVYPINSDSTEIIYQHFSTIKRYLDYSNTDNKTTPSATDDNETIVSTLWKNILNLKNMPQPSNHFFEDGGTSIQAVELLSKLYGTLKVDISLPDFLKQPTLGNIISLLKNSTSIANTANHKVVETQLRDVIAVATDNQKWLWLNKKIDNHSWHYNLPFTLKISGELNVNAFQQSITDIIIKYPALRTIFFEESDASHLYQNILHYVANKLEIITIDNLLNQDTQLLIEQKYTTEFNFIKTPPYQFTLLKQSNHNWLFIVNVHHIVFDAESLKIFFNELSRRYNQYRNNQTPEQVSISIPQINTTANLNTDYSAGLNYWKAVLSGLTSMKLPYNYMRPVENTHKGRYLDILFNKEKTKAIMDFAKRHKVSLQIVMLSAMGVLLKSYGNSDICIPISISGRTHKNRDEIGFFSNTLPIRIGKVCHDVKALLDTCETAFTEAYQHSELPFYQVINQLNIEREGSYNLFNQLLLSVFDETYTKPPELDDLTLEYHRYGYNAARMDLTIEVMPHTNGELRIGAYYSDVLFNYETIQQLLQQLYEIIITLVQSKSTLKKATNNEVSCIAGKLVPLCQRKLHSYFEIKQQQSPDAVALWHQDRTMTYAELNQEAQFIHQIIHQKCSDLNTHAAIYLPRDFSLIASYIALSQCGIALTPIDHHSPHSWIKRLLNTIKPGIIVTNSQLVKNLDYRPGTTVVLVDDIDDHSNLMNNKLPPTISDTNKIAYTLFTSGTTNYPKAVNISHKNVVNLIEWALSEYKNDELKAVLFSTSVSFDLSIFEIFATLSAGGSVYIVENILELVDRPNLPITLINTIPTAINTIHQHSAIPKTTTTINLAGELLSKHLVNSLYELSHINKVYNLYAPTETTTYSTYKLLQKNSSSITIGAPINNTAIHIVDSDLNEVPIGTEGEIAISGYGVSLGYMHTKQSSQDKFVKNSLSRKISERLYLTGDYGYVDKNNEIRIIGRQDTQVKINGHRIELSLIDNILSSHPNVISAATTVSIDTNTKQKVINAFIIPSYWDKDEEQHLLTLKNFLQAQLPHYMVPTHYKLLKEFPQLQSGKLNRRALQQIKADSIYNRASQDNYLNKNIISAWEQTLGHNNFSIYDSFFEVGGNSLLSVKLHDILSKSIPQNFRLIDIFIYPTIVEFQAFIEEQNKHSTKQPTTTEDRPLENHDIAIIATACRFPEISNIDELWQVLKNQQSTIQSFDDETLNKFKVAESRQSRENFINRCGFVDNLDYFDNQFFDYSPIDATQIDPQQRVFLELCWEALEKAGCIPEKSDTTIGVFAGSGPNFYKLKQLPDDDTIEQMKWALANEKDYLATRAAYKLNLKGPAININTACSTSLVAIANACQYINTGVIDTAIAGGVSLILPENVGYLYNQDHIFSASGECRPFDAVADGTVPSSGAAVIVLKRYDKAVADGDDILGVIKGFAMNNDGHQKASFTAPNARQQTACLKQALFNADLDSSKVSYIEAHGTGTNIGDPIEMEAIKSAYQDAHSCHIGSIKANIGHTDACAGIAGVLKIIAMMQHRQIPAQTNFDTLNKKISFENNKFIINQQLQPWQSDQGLYAGISSFGIGGTNVHLIIQEPPKVSTKNLSTPAEGPALIVLSAKTEASLKKMRSQLADFISTQGQCESAIDLLHNIAYTLVHHRAEFKYRFACLCYDIDDAINQLNNGSTLQKHAQSAIKTLAKQWLNTEAVDWEMIYPKNSGIRLPLPTYAFDRQRYYIDTSSATHSKSDVAHTKNKVAIESVPQELSDIWSELLGVTNIQLDVDFFDLGGDSLLLLRMLARIKKRWNIELSFDDVFDHCTPQGIANLIDAKLPTQNSQISLKLLRTGDSDITIVFIHPGNGSLFQYQSLIKKSASSCAIYGINNTCLHLQDSNFTSIKHYAQSYLKLIKQQLPDQKIILAGWSFGGTVAYEMAQSKSYDNIRGLLLLDSWAQYPASFNQEDVFKELVNADDTLTEQQSALLVDVLKQRMQQLFSYKPKPLNKLPVILFKASATASLNRIKYNYWEQHIDNLHALLVDGNHDNLLAEEHIESLVDYFDKVIENFPASLPILKE